MKKYYFHDGTAQQGPFDLDELQTKNITAETPIWFDPMPDWKPAYQFEELKGIIVHTPPSFHTSAPPLSATHPIPIVASSPSTTQPAKPSKKSTAWISWVLSLLVLGGVGYYVYTDMQQKKEAGNNGEEKGAVTNQNDKLADVKGVPFPKDKDASINQNTEKSITSRTNNPNTQNVASLKDKSTGIKTNAGNTVAKYAEIRNHWPNYISFGKLDYKAHSLSGVKAFDVPVINNSDFTIDQVTVRVDYIKSSGDVYKNETIVINSIPAHSTLSGKAEGSSRGTSVNAYITGIVSKKINFCYPQNNGNPGDPYFCK